MVSVLNQNEFLVVRRAECGAEVPSRTAGQLPTGKDSPALGLGQAGAEASQADPLSLSPSTPGPGCADAQTPTTSRTCSSSFYLEE